MRIGLAAAAALLLGCADNSDPKRETKRRARPESRITRQTDAARERAPTWLNALVLAQMKSYPSGGGYRWPSKKGTHGTVRDLSLAGHSIAKSGEHTNCSGFTFDVLWRALEARPGGLAATGLTPERARSMRRTWYVPEQFGPGPAAALPKHGLGRRIPELAHALPGDFIQVWFNDGGGHTAVFLGWQRDRAGAIRGVRYWSSQPQTKGIGVHTRRIGAGKRDIDRARIFIARAEL